MDEKYKIEVAPHGDTGELLDWSEEEWRQAIRLAGWSDDPGSGKAIVLPDGREVFNPVAVAPPVGWKPEPDMFQIMQAMVKRELAALKGDEIEETAEEAEDFEIDEEFDPMSIYEVVDMKPDPGPVPPGLIDGGNDGEVGSKPGDVGVAKVGSEGGDSKEPVPAGAGVVVAKGS